MKRMMMMVVLAVVLLCGFAAQAMAQIAPAARGLDLLRKNKPATSQLVIRSIMNANLNEAADPGEESLNFPVTVTFPDGSSKVYRNNPTIAVPPGTCLVTVDKPDGWYGFALLDGAVALSWPVAVNFAGTPGEVHEVDFLLYTTGRVIATVVDQDGNGVPNIMVWISGTALNGAGTEVYGFTDEKGRLEWAVLPGYYYTSLGFLEGWVATTDPEVGFPLGMLETKRVSFGVAPWPPSG